MLKREPLGTTKLNTNRICLGTGSFGGSTPEEQCLKQLDYFRSQGGNFIDTAVGYCDWLIKPERSCSQKLLGRWMRDKHCRAEMIISCKGCHDAVLVPTDNALTSQRAEPQLHRADIIKAIDVSLMNLMTDYLDIFTLHKDNPAVPVAEIITTLQEQKQQGKILAYGCSNWTVERQREAVSYALSHGCDGFSVDQIGWCLNVQNVDSPSYKTKVLMDDEAYRFHQQSKIPVMAYAANGRAYFHRLANQLEVRDQERSEYDNDINRRILAVLMQAAQETGAEVNTIVISYLLLDHGFQTIPIIGVKSIRELDICLAALDYQLPTVFEQQLRALTR